jgi:uncharacterized protein YbjT (DUF2867 family)
MRPPNIVNYLIPFIFASLNLNILLTGITGYIGKRLLPSLLAQGHHVVCCVRDRARFPAGELYPDADIEVYEVDFLRPVDSATSPKDIDAAFYLIHSMSTAAGDFERLEKQTAQHFVDYLDATSARQIIYLGGILKEDELSKHLRSRKATEDILRTSRIPLTALRAGIIVGSGSASFEIIRDLVEKLPVMVTPRWLNTEHQPIAVDDVLQYLTAVIGNPTTYNQTYDIGGPDILTYREMLLGYAKARNLRRFIFTVPVMTPRLSSYWLYFVTSTSYSLAVNLVNSMKIRIVCHDTRLREMVGLTATSYEEAVRSAIDTSTGHRILSSWKDAYSSSSSRGSIDQHSKVPDFGCYIETREQEITTNVEDVLKNVWSIGGERGWYYANWLWSLRGLLDKLCGGTGLRRGRTNPTEIYAGDALDFWRVIVADKAAGRLLLFAEMRLPGEAWLEFRVLEKNGTSVLRQTATFRPRGVSGRMYWYSVLPFHKIIFKGMVENIIRYRPGRQSSHRNLVESNS